MSRSSRDPKTSQVGRRRPHPFDPHSVRGQTQAGDMRIKVTRRKTGILDSLEKDAKVHRAKVILHRCF